jgi:hypothetical protein
MVTGVLWCNEDLSSGWESQHRTTSKCELTPFSRPRRWSTKTRGFRDFRSDSDKRSGNERGKPIVFVVDDDPSIREALDSLLRSVGLGVQTFASA